MSEHQPVRDLTFEQYQSAEGVSASMLKVIRESSPLHLMWAMKHPEPPTPAQRFGALVHAAILTPDLSLYYVKPDKMDFRSKDGKQWQEAHADQPIVTGEEHTSIEGMKASVHRHPTAARLLKNAEFERSLFVTDKQGTLRKLRPDMLPKAGNILPDLKTCESAHPDDFSKSIGNYGYYAQGAYYLDGTQMIGREFEFFAFIAVEKSPPYACAVYTLDPMAVDFGRRIYGKDLEVYRKCILENHWPAYGDGAPCISLPPYMQKQMEELA
jgi:hypothetical protein